MIAPLSTAELHVGAALVAADDAALAAAEDAALAAAEDAALAAAGGAAVAAGLRAALVATRLGAEAAVVAALLLGVLP